MKPPPFTYHDPAGVDEALELLAEHGIDSKVLAGGQSLVPLLNFRLSYPEHLIDVNLLDELAYVRADDEALRIGALARQSELERSEVVAERWPLLTEAMTWLAHPQIRNRGTVGGSVAHADPAAELPVALTALGASYHVRSARGARTIGPDEFYVTHLTTAIERDELLVEIEVPAVAPGTGHAFTEFARRHGDFALGGAAVLIRLGDDGTCAAATVALLGAAPTPVRATGAEEALVGRAPEADAVAAAAEAAVSGIEPTGDIHGSTEYRTHLIEALTRRAITTAASRAGGFEDADA